MQKRSIALALLSVLGVSAQAGVWYTDEASFLLAIDPIIYEENFDGWTFGSPFNGGQTTWDAPGANGYDWTAAQSGGLWSNISALSTFNADTTITITFTGDPVSAFGGYLANTDVDGNIIAGTSSLTFSNGDTGSVNNTAGVDAFLGWVGDDLSDTVTSVNLTSAFTAGGDWTQIDGAITGAVPEPATMAALGLGLAALARRRKKA